MYLPQCVKWPSCGSQTAGSSLGGSAMRRRLLLRGSEGTPRIQGAFSGENRLCLVFLVAICRTFQSIRIDESKDKSQCDANERDVISVRPAGPNAVHRSSLSVV